MPEMPEVETIARNLRRTVVGKQIAGVLLSSLPLRKPVDRKLAGRLQGRTIRRVHRRGKYLILELTPQAFCVIHLGMSGRIILSPRSSAPPKHTHATIFFSDETKLQFRDPRRFGWLAVHEVPKLDRIPELMALGLEPLDESFTSRWLFDCLQRSQREVKALLLDQTQIAGLGNIYVCESLFRAFIHPGRRCSKITEQEAGKLNRAIRGVLSAAVRHRGTSFSDFQDANGRLGENQKYLGVYQREGKKCRRCGSEIRRLTQGNRSSFFCPHCQNR
jgi:formamidopyrimidine-DNA glycosylase